MKSSNENFHKIRGCAKVTKTEEHGIMKLFELLDVRVWLRTREDDNQCNNPVLDDKISSISNGRGNFNFQWRM